MLTPRSLALRSHAAASLLIGSLLFLLPSCTEENYYTTTPPVGGGGGKTATKLQPGEDPPGIVLTVLSIGGASGADGTFQAGDAMSVTFKATKKSDGTSWLLEDFARGRILVAGPSFNYQLVIPEQQDVLTRSVKNADGTFTYTFAQPIPAVYQAPLNDSAALGEADGELQGKTLLGGTYTVGLYTTWEYTVGTESFSDAGNVTADFLYGGATQLEPREVVKDDNCNQCHQSLRAHGGMRREVKLCLMCHTSGAEDFKVSSGDDPTPGLTIDFRVMIHKIHAGAHLPSVLGVATKDDGSRDYSAPKRPYQVRGRNNSVHDYSGVAFPVWPAASIAMPRDFGYTQLAAAAKTQEDTIRTGVVDCYVCHGDPDADGPLTAPAQGGIAFSQPTRRACGSCHDDLDWEKPYTANQSTMPPQATDSACLLCHGATAAALSPQAAHVHPLKDPDFNPGLHFLLTAVKEAGTHNNDQTVDVGEKVELTVRITNDKGEDVAPSAISAVSAVLNGPTSNNQLVLNATIPTAAFSGTPPYKLNIPEVVYLEAVGTSTTSGGEKFKSARAPHWDLSGAVTTVWTNTMAGGASVLSADAKAPQNWIDVADPAGFARNDYIRIGAGTDVEYLQIQTVQGNRLWFSSPATTNYAPGLRKDRAASTGVVEVVLTQKTKGTDYTLDKVTGEITEVTEFGDGVGVVVSYTTDFVLPATYGLAMNDTPDLDEASGKWTGKPIASGTYGVTLWSARNLTLSAYGETNSYRGTSHGGRLDFRVGDAKSIEPYALITSANACYACHQDLYFHGGGRRGFDTCISCHGNAGFEDRTQYVAPNAPPTTGVAVDFRNMLHTIHMGEHLTHASAYLVNGFGSAAYPNNFSTHSYEHVVFPALPGGVSNCVKCHGSGNTAWLQPSTRNHPTAQGQPVLAWRAVCGACHDGDAAVAHIDLNTAASGAESCAVCHAQDREWHVDLVHKTR